MDEEKFAKYLFFGLVVVTVGFVISLFFLRKDPKTVVLGARPELVVVSQKALTDTPEETKTAVESGWCVATIKTGELIAMNEAEKSSVMFSGMSSETTFALTYKSGEAHYTRDHSFLLINNTLVYLPATKGTAFSFLGIEFIVDKVTAAELVIRYQLPVK